MARYPLYVATRGDGPPVVLIHGLMVSGEMFRWLADALASRFRLLIPDLPGLSGFDSRPWLPSLRAPTLVVSGGQDRAVPAHHAEMLAGAIPDARSVTIPAAGHTMIWTHPDRLADILATWWTSIDDKSAEV